MSRNDDSIAAQMELVEEDEPYGSVAEGVFESRQRAADRVDGTLPGHLRTPVTERRVAGVDLNQLNTQQANHSSMSEGVASAGNPMNPVGMVAAREAYGSAERMDRMGDFNPANANQSAGERMGSGDVQFGGSGRVFQSTPMNDAMDNDEGVGGNSLGGDPSTGEGMGGFGDRDRDHTRDHTRRGMRGREREVFGETTMTQSVMHESNLFYGDGDDNDNEGTNTPARLLVDEGGDVTNENNQKNTRPERSVWERPKRLEWRNVENGNLVERQHETDGNQDGQNNDNYRGISLSRGGSGGDCIVRQVPSEIAMVMGLSEGENDVVLDGERKMASLLEPTDSNMGCIDINDAMDDDKVIGSGSFKNRPSDADIIAWENQIKRRAQESSMLIGNKVSLDELVDEYARGSNEQWKANVASLTKAYRSMRRSRGDGNCFFRAFLFSYLEHVVESGDVVERNRVMQALARIKAGLLRAGYEELVLEAPMELLSDILGSVPSLTVDALERQLRTEDVSNYIIFLLRIITSGEVKQNADFFAPFILGLVDMTVDEFCAKCIDPMGEESDHVVLVALTNALRVPMRVVYVDGREGRGDLDVKDFVPDGCSSADIHVHLLFRPGHYDILYMQ